MARKNRKKKFREHHKKLLEREKKHMDKLAHNIDPEVIAARKQKEI